MAEESEADRMVVGADRPVDKVEGKVQYWQLELVAESQSEQKSEKQIL